jgi:hypothetical protein
MERPKNWLAGLNVVNHRAPGLAGSFLIATVILLVLKKRWISAVVGSVVSAPFYIYGSGSLAHGLLFGNTILARTEIWIVAPAVLTVLSFIFAIRQRIA